MSLFSELQRRNVLRVGAAYIVSSWLLIQVAETIFPLFGFGDAPARMVVILLAIGFVPTLVISWVFELTPEGFKRESRIRAGETATPHGGKNLDRLIMVVLALAVGYFAFDKFVLDPARDAAREAQIAEDARTEAYIGSFGRNSLAVLPFANMSSDAENEYFSDGIAEEVLNLLAKIPGLRVISRSSSFSYRGKDLDIPSIAEQLNVALVLEGSVRRYGDQVRITAQLIEARSDTHLWSETYQRELKDVFAIQDEISSAIVAALQATINLNVDQAPRSTEVVNQEAHDAYLRGRYLLAQREVEGAGREFERAISLEPDYALAHAQLAIAHLLGYRYSNRAESVAVTEALIDKAMALNPAIAEAHAAAGYLAEDQGDIQGALKHYQTAIQINPNHADAVMWMANMLSSDLGRYAEGFSMLEKAVRLDPLSVPALFNYVDNLIRRDKLVEADRELEKLASMAPDLARFLRGFLKLKGGDGANAAHDWLETVRNAPDFSLRSQFLLAYWFAIVGLEEEAIAMRGDEDSRLLSFLGKQELAVNVAQASLAKTPDSPQSRDAVGLALAGAGEFALARPHLEAWWQESEGRILANTSGIYLAAALIEVRRAGGEEDKVADLLAAIRDNVRRYQEAGMSTTFWFTSPEFENGLASFLDGDPQQGLELIARAVEDGFSIPPGQAYLQDLYEHPGFAAIREVQTARATREREKFLGVVCVDNPYAEVWQPAEGTCEEFVVGAGNLISRNGAS
ncbi:MAG: tetratricopeptide repeat protein [Xanthomonadales bacterium]|nr:tetratricopeptide repeat protein [Xanthomonadales bacterium]